MKNCFILGCGRSGTSALAGMLQKAGYYVGDQMHQPNQLNPLGYFEDVTINELNNETLRPFLKVFGQPYPKDSEWLSILPVDTEVDHGLDVDRAKEFIKPPFALKDPRFCYTYPLWYPLVGPQPIVTIVLFRHPGEVVESILNGQRVEWHDLPINPRYYLEVWNAMYRHVLKNDPENKFVYIGHRPLMTGRATRILSSVLAAELDDSFIDKRLVRPRNVLDWSIPVACEDVWKRLCDRGGRWLFRDPTVPQPAGRVDDPQVLEKY